MGQRYYRYIQYPAWASNDPEGMGYVPPPPAEGQTLEWHEPFSEPTRRRLEGPVGWFSIDPTELGNLGSLNGETEAGHLVEDSSEQVSARPRARGFIEGLPPAASNVETVEVEPVNPGSGTIEWMQPWPDPVHRRTAPPGVQLVEPQPDVIEPVHPGDGEIEWFQPWLDPRGIEPFIAGQEVTGDWGDDPEVEDTEAPDTHDPGHYKTDWDELPDTRRDEEREFPVERTQRETIAEGLHRSYNGLDADEMPAGVQRAVSEAVSPFRDGGPDGAALPAASEIDFNAMVAAGGAALREAQNAINLAVARQAAVAVQKNDDEAASILLLL